MSKQTAVEWLLHQIESKNGTEFSSYYTEFIEQAKEMEKRQIVYAWSNGFDEDDRATSNPFKYYNETYGGNK